MVWWQTAAGFAEGMKATFDFMKDAIVKIKVLFEINR